MGSRRVLGLRRAVTRLTAGRPAAELLVERPEEEEEEAVAAMERALWGREKAARERRIRRLMEPAGPPERTLTRQAMEQIRYLSRELPEEWPVDRLAQGFQVPPDVIRRVLRSRFVPSPERAQKQDARALAGRGAGRQGCLEASLPREATFRLLTPLPGGSAGALPPGASELPVPMVAQGKPEVEVRRAARPGPEEEAETVPMLSLEVVEELAAQDWHKHNPAWVPVQRGWEFFDREGNLLYKVPLGHLKDGKGSQ
ncbi:neugrin [Pogona vitticeps]